jgi:hypothetical protein
MLLSDKVGQGGGPSPLLLPPSRMVVRWLLEAASTRRRPEVPDLAVVGSARSGLSAPTVSEVGGPTWCSVFATEKVLGIVGSHASGAVGVPHLRPPTWEVRLLRAKSFGEDKYQ